jgi:urease accessory protein
MGWRPRAFSLPNFVFADPRPYFGHYMDDASREGKGHIVLSPVGDKGQVLSTLFFQYPLKLISPRLPSQPCTAVFMMSYGGGLVGGDQIELKVDVERGCKLSLLTQGSTKIFKQRIKDGKSGPFTSQSLRVRISDGGLLALIPDPIQPFEDSCYSQHQSFELHANANLVLLDWVNSGRPARGENWTLKSFRSRNDIYQLGQTEDEKHLVLRDTLIMNTNVARSMYPHQCFATVILRGPLLKEFSASVITKFKNEERVRRPSAMRPQASPKRATWTAGIVRDGCCVIKIAGESGELVKEFLVELLVVGELESLLGREALRSLL